MALDTRKTAPLFIVLLLLALAGWSYYRSRNNQANIPPVDNSVIEQTEMNEQAENVSPSPSAPITEEEKKDIDQKIEQDGQSTMLRDVSNGTAYGTAYRIFSDGKFYYKAILRDLLPMEKGYYYEGWMVDQNGKYFSTGRVWPDAAGGTIYYTTSEDKSDYSRTVVTLEAEDNNPAPDKHILEGQF